MTRSLRARLLIAMLAVVILTLVIAGAASRTITRVQMRKIIATQGPAGGHVATEMKRHELPRRDSTLALDRSLLGAFGSAALIALIAAWFVARQITEPIEKLTAAARRMAGGDRNARVEVRSNDEIGELATAFNAMSASVAQNEELRRRTVTDVAHELRTPLTNVRGHIESIQDGLREPSRAVIDSIHADLLTLQRLIDDLQELSGELRLRTAPMKLRPVVERVAASFNAGVDGDDAEVIADETRIAQVLSNLLSNAVRYSNDVRARILNSGEEVVVSVIDRGEGIAEDDLPYIFDRFYRGDPSRSRETGGAGLGLAIVKQIVEAHGGRVWVESARGDGSAFHFALPLAHS